MNIDREKLKMGIWYEDKNGKMIKKTDDYSCDIPEGVVTYHSCFPLEVTEKIYKVHDKNEKSSCKHKRKWWEKDNGLIKGYKGHTCAACGCSQLRKWWQPWGRKWDYGTEATLLLEHHTGIGGGNQDLILAMVNSGDYTLKEAIAVLASACERCLNVLAYKYLNGADGYAEHSEEWKKCNTVCDFCK